MSNITVTKVGTLSIGRLLGTVNLIIGLAIGIVAATVGTVTFLTTSQGFFDGLLGSIAIILAAVVLDPLVLLAFGWLYGVLVSFIFNVVTALAVV